MEDKPKSVRHAQPELLIRILALLLNGQGVGRSTGLEVVCTYAFEVTVNYIVVVEELETITNIE